MESYCRLIPRLNGAEIEENFGYYLNLVKKGVAGFIVFGGELEILKAGIKELKRAAGRPLIISSDLEQGLGQHVNGGTIFPPAMAIASALEKMDTKAAALLIEKLYTAFALEAGYAGINTIFAPVLDINTNPENPIIATRSFGEDTETVTYIGCEMIRILQENNIMACGKHFPGHGDTETDSHMQLPVIKKSLSALEGLELIPFKRAIEAGVRMLMLGHLSVPSMDPSGRPATLSKNIIAYLREKMEFQGLMITDAMNMGSIGAYTEEEASLMALRAGVDIVLHPSSPDKVAAYLQKKAYMPKPLNLNITNYGYNAPPDFNKHKKLADELTERAIQTYGNIAINKPFIIILNDEPEQKGMTFLNTIKTRHPHVRHCTVLMGNDIPWQIIPKDHDLIVGIFSAVKAWKGNTRVWLDKCLRGIEDRNRIFISFGNPYLLNKLQRQAKICAFWDSEAAQKAVAEKILPFIRGT